MLQARGLPSCAHEPGGQYPNLGHLFPLVASAAVFAAASKIVAMVKPMPMTDVILMSSPLRAATPVSRLQNRKRDKGVSVIWPGVAAIERSRIRRRPMNEELGPCAGHLWHRSAC
jgi:hypothetical protein